MKDERKGRKLMLWQTGPLICWSNKAHVRRINKASLIGYKAGKWLKRRHFRLSWPVQGWKRITWCEMTFYRLNNMPYTEQSPFSPSLPLCSRAVQLERGRGGLQKMRSGGKRKTVRNKHRLLNSGRPASASQFGKMWTTANELVPFLIQDEMH